METSEHSQTGRNGNGVADTDVSRDLLSAEPAHPWERYRDRCPGIVLLIDGVIGKIAALTLLIAKLKAEAVEAIRRSNEIITTNNQAVVQRAQARRERASTEIAPVQARIDEIRRTLQEVHKLAAEKGAAAGRQYDAAEIDPLMSEQEASHGESVQAGVENRSESAHGDSGDPAAGSSDDEAENLPQHSTNLPASLVKFASIVVMGVMLGLSIGFLVGAISPGTLLPRLLLTVGFVTCGIGLTIVLSQANYAIWQLAGAQAGWGRTLLIAVALLFSATIVGGEAAAEYQGVLNCVQREQISLTDESRTPVRPTGDGRASDLDGALVLVALLSSIGMISITAVDGLKSGLHGAVEVAEESKEPALSDAPPTSINEPILTDTDPNVMAYNGTVACVRALVHERNQLSAELLLAAKKLDAEIKTIDANHCPFTTEAPDAILQQISAAELKFESLHKTKDALCEQLANQITATNHFTAATK